MKTFSRLKNYVVLWLKQKLQVIKILIFEVFSSKSLHVVDLTISLIKCAKFTWLYDTNLITSRKLYIYEKGKCIYKNQQKEYLDMQCEEKRKNIYSRKLDKSFLKRNSSAGWSIWIPLAIRCSNTVLKIQFRNKTIARIIRNINLNNLKCT